MLRSLNPRVKVRHHSLKLNGRIPQETPEEAIPNKMMRMMRRMRMRIMRMMKILMILDITLCLERKVRK
jgi:predicted SAM-dependent methyltransferase